MWLLALLLLTISVQAEQIRLLPEVIVPPGEIYLGHVAEFIGYEPSLEEALSQIVVGRAGLPGETRRVTQTYVLARLSQFGHAQHRSNVVGAEIILATTRYQSLGQEDLLRAIDQALLPYLSSGEEIEVEISQLPQEVRLGLGEVRIEVGLDLRSQGAGSLTIPMRIFLDGKLVKTLNPRLILRRYAPVAVVERPLARGEVLRQEDLRWERREISQLHRPVLILPGGDLLVTRAVSPGTVLTWSHLEEAPIVGRGDLVTVWVQIGGVQVEVLGQALTHGALGEVIGVRNLESRRVIYGEVLDAETVRVRLLGS